MISDRGEYNLYELHRVVEWLERRLPEEWSVPYYAGSPGALVAAISSAAEDIEAVEADVQKVCGLVRSLVPSDVDEKGLMRSAATAGGRVTMRILRHALKALPERMDEPCASDGVLESTSTLRPHVACLAPESPAC